MTRRKKTISTSTFKNAAESNSTETLDVSFIFPITKKDELDKLGLIKESFSFLEDKNYANTEIILVSTTQFEEECKQFTWDQLINVRVISSASLYFNENMVLAVEQAQKKFTCLIQLDQIKSPFNLSIILGMDTSKIHEKEILNFTSENKRFGLFNKSNYCILVGQTGNFKEIIGLIPSKSHEFIEHLIYILKKEKFHFENFLLPKDILSKSKRSDFFNSKIISITAWFNWFFKIPVKDIIISKGIFSPSFYRLIFVCTALLIMFLLPFLSRDAGISGDEVKHRNQAIKVYHYYETLGEDTSALYNINAKDPMQFNGQSFDVINYFIEKIFNIEKIYETRHLLNALVGWLIILFAGLLAKELMGWGAGISTMILLLITPTFLGHTYNNNKDIPLALGFILSTYYTIKFFSQLPRPELKVLIMLCVSIAIAISTRIVGVLLFGYISIYALLFVIQNIKKQQDKKGYLIGIIKYLVIIFISGYFIGILLWPYALENPISSFFEINKAIKNFPLALNQVFEGQLVWSDHIPWYYVPKYMLITFPAVILAGIFLFLIFSYRIFTKSKWLQIFIVAFSFLFPIAYACFYNKNDYGGWRHLIFAFPPLVICAVSGYSAFLKLFANRKIRSIILIGIAALLFKPVAHIIRNHPLEYIYYNELEGGVDKAYGNYEMDYFQNSFRGASEWLLKKIKASNPKKDKKIIIAANGYINYFFRKDTALISTIYCNYYNRKNFDWDFMIACNTYIDPDRLRDNSYPPANTIYKIKVDNAIVCAILERKQKYDLQASKSLESGDILKAIALYEKAYAIEPENNDISHNLIKCYIINKNFDIAFQKIDSILKIDPYREEVLILRGIAFLNCHKLKDALNQFNEIIQKVNSKNPNAYYYLGVCFLIQKKYDDALRYFIKCLKFSRNNKLAYLQIANILKLQHKDKEAQQVMSLYKKLQLK
jgi:tetratricopeptide (TPR) repeat protein